ncbi:hypothetical protein TSAR_002338 [Trichomalopsis sarcophagae]|uniref:Uncharacterized protein n=1 Tax=Trichomalopsis sarcophagae TaxID=543379 RepID=A0A232EKK7_9HYME|nr:hypothetical protein TSAR_002338 [Trichomalopsis sarcophagae]
MFENGKSEKEEMKRELIALRAQIEEDRHRIDRLKVELRETKEGIDMVESEENCPELVRDKEVENSEDISNNSRGSPVEEIDRDGEEIDNKKMDKGPLDLIGKCDYLKKKMLEKLG